MSRIRFTAEGARTRVTGHGAGGWLKAQGTRRTYSYYYPLPLRERARVRGKRVLFCPGPGYGISYCADQDSRTEHSRNLLCSLRVFAVISLLKITVEIFARSFRMRFCVGM